MLDRQALTKRQQKIGSESESDEGSDSDDYSVDDAIDEMKAEIS